MKVEIINHNGKACIDLKYFNNAIDELEEQEKHIKEANLEIERLNNIINEIYTKALDTSITSLDLRDYIINIKWKNINDRI